jgi:hypothetical protein
MCACASHVSCLQYVPQFSAAAFDSKFGYVRTQLHKPRVYIYMKHAHVFLHKQWIMAAVIWVLAHALWKLSWW